MSTYRILSIDGGGIRGLLVAVLLERLDQLVPGWRDRTDLFAGTSTGGIIALGLAKGMEPSELRRLYYEESPYIFDSPWYETREWVPIVRAKYSNRALRKRLEDVFAASRLQEFEKNVLVASFDLEKGSGGDWKPKFFHNFAGEDSDGNAGAVDVALATSAAPTYFPTAGGYIDGGVAANNPSMAALAQALDGRASDDRPKLDEVTLLSLGTGRMPRAIKGARHDWGFARWARHLLWIMFDGLGGVPDYQCSQLLADRYHRLDPTLEEAIELDDWLARKELVRLGESEKMDEALKETAAWLEAKWMS